MADPEEANQVNPPPEELTATQVTKLMASNCRVQAPKLIGFEADSITVLEPVVTRKNVLPTISAVMLGKEAVTLAVAPPNNTIGEDAVVRVLPEAITCTPRVGALTCLAAPKSSSVTLSLMFSEIQPAILTLFLVPIIPLYSFL